MLFDVSVVFGLGALALWVRWLLLRDSERGYAQRIRPFPAASISSCLVVAVLATLPVVTRASLQTRLSHDASALLGVKVKVICQTLTGSALDLGVELGYVKWGADGVPEHSTLIKHVQCNDLEAYLDSGKAHPSAAQVLAVHVLTHESMHMSGITSEALAECDATQDDSRLARIMGASAAAAHELAQRYWATVYPRMPDGYTSSDCRPGGSMDLHLADPAWAS